MTVDICRNLLPIWKNLEFARGLVLIDEIETHLHPRWKLKIMTSLRKAFPKVQFIVTTHDPLCLRGMLNGEVAVFHRDKNSNISQIKELPNIKSLRADQLLTSDFFGLSSTSDPEFEAELNQLALLAVKNANEVNQKDSKRLRSLEQSLSNNLIVGDSPAEQLAYEAFRRYVAERNNAIEKDRAKLKEEAVSKIVDFLKSQIKN